MAARQAADQAEIEVEPTEQVGEVPQSFSPGQITEASEEHEGTTRPQDLGFPASQQARREIEVESLGPLPQQQDSSGLVQVRMAYTIEEFTYGNPHRAYRLEEGHVYRLPVDVARYLNGVGAIYFR